MTKISEALSAANIVVYYNESKAATSFPGEMLFPAKKKLGLDLKYLETVGSGVRVLKRSNFDTLPPLRERLKATSYEFEMPFFREQMDIKERDRQELNKIREANNPYFEEMISTIYGDRVDLINGAKASAERMRMQLLFTGGIDLSDSEGLDTVYDYGFDASTQETVLAGPAMWSDHANATPINDLQAAQTAANIKGQAIAYMTQKTFTDLISCASVKDSIYPNLGATGIISNTIITSFIQANFSIRIVVIDALADNYFYVDEKGVEMPFVPDNVVSIASTGEIGNTWFGTTPEESDLMGGTKDLNIEIVERGIAVVSKTSYGPPVQHSTTAAMICLSMVKKISGMHIIKTA